MGAGTWSEELAAYRADRTSGAMALAQWAAEIVIAWAREHPAARREAFVAALEDLLRALREAHPDMAPPWHLTTAAREAVAGATDGPAARAAVIAAMQAFRQRLQDHEEAAAGHAAALLRSIRVLFTHSRSRLVAQALARAAADGHRIQVLCPIAEPGGEGRRMAEEAAAQGHTVLLLPDLVAAHYLPHADLVLVGADAWDAEGIINKVGTLAFAVLARHFQRPFFVVATAEKRWPPAAGPHPARRPTAAASGEIPWFEFVPWDLLTGLILETGLHPEGP